MCFFGEMSKNIRETLQSGLLLLVLWEVTSLQGGEQQIRSETAWARAVQNSQVCFKAALF